MIRSPCPTASAVELNEILRVRTAAVVDLRSLSALGHRHPDLSGLFVPAISERYLRSAFKLMIVGRETRGWHGLLKDIGAAVDTDSHIGKTMAYHSMKVTKVAARSKFFQFYRKASQLIAHPEDVGHLDAPCWSNLYCMSLKNTRPTTLGDRNAVDQIKDLSKKLLHIQLQVLQPDLVIFATGYSCDSDIKEFFGEFDYSKAHIKHRIWEMRGFADVGLKADGTPFRAFRTLHPRRSEADADRMVVLETQRDPGALTRYVQAHQHNSR